MLRKAAKPQAIAQRNAALERTEIEMLERLDPSVGLVPGETLDEYMARRAAARRARTLELLTRDDLSKAERREFNRLAEEERARKAAKARYEAAERTWEERSTDPEWRRHWEGLADESRRGYGAGASSARAIYLVHEVMGGDEGERKRLRDWERDLASEEAEGKAYRQEQRRIDEERAHTAAPVAAVAPPELAESAPRRRRVRAGLVALWDSQGRLVYDDEDD